MKNSDIAGSIKMLADLMELHGENQFRTRAYRNAYNSIRKFDRPLAEMHEEEIASIQGVGASTASKINELVTTGVISRLEEYRAKTPPGIIELMGIRGLGPSRVRAVWDGLGVESPGELLYACNENRLVELSGFGLKTQDDIRQKLGYFLESRDKKLYAAVEDNMQRIVEMLQTAFPEASISPVGELARFCPVVNTLEFLVGDEISHEALEAIDGIEVEAANGVIRCRETGQLPFIVHTCSRDAYEVRKFRLTGPESFVEKFDMPVASDEHDVFRHNGVPYIIPEMRDTWEPERDDVPDEASIIDIESIRGILHNHSTYSDGLHTLREMSEYVRDSGYEYFGISDHSQTAVYAGGLKPDAVLAQMEEIESLNQELAPFRVFSGIESDILSDGSLDYEDDLLSKFDFVVASVHSGLKMDEGRATARLIGAIEHPCTTILGHPTSRLLLARQGYPLDHKKIIDACAANKVAIELNANPLRLDLDYTWIPYAMQKEVWIAINPDAHSMGGIDNVRFGVYAARKGGLLKERCLNALSLSGFERWLADRR